MAWWDTIIRNVEGVGEVRGMYLHAFIKNGENYYLSEIKIYKDGMIDCWGLVDFEGFKEKIASGWVRTQLPEDAPVMIYPMVYLKAKDVECGVTEEEFVKEVRDELDRLNGKPTTLDLCMAAFWHWHKHPSEEAREKLRAAYESVPAHNRCYFGDMDVMDLPVRKVLYEMTPYEEERLATYGRVWLTHFERMMESKESAGSPSEP